ncbi:yacP-like NYN domain protein [Sesbania bispinosa]|nr:yacP-like NYN domain protein [Sesbania bispinosa]
MNAPESTRISRRYQRRIQIKFNLPATDDARRQHEIVQVYRMTDDDANQRRTTMRTGKERPREETETLGVCNRAKQHNTRRETMKSKSSLSS